MLENIATDLQSNNFISEKSVQDLIQIANILSSSISKKCRNYAATHPTDYKKIGFKLYVEPEYEKKIVSNNWPYSDIIGIYFFRGLRLMYRNSNQSMFLNNIRIPNIKIPFAEDISLYVEKWYDYPEFSPKILKSSDFYWKKFNKMLLILYDQLCENLFENMKKYRVTRLDYNITPANVPCINIIISD